MSLIAPLPEAEAVDKTAQTYARLKETLGVAELPDAILAMGRVEPFLRDFYMNFKRFVATDGAIDARTKAVIAYATACQAKSTVWIDILRQRALTLGIEETQLTEVLAVVSTNSMYNTFFKFRDLSGSELFSGMAVGLRAHLFSATSLGEQWVEMINIAISNLNACKPCTSGHVDAARQMGLKDEQILEVIQCAATVASACQFTSVASLDL
ncbi:MAG: carboxymuconolactone decarboxylase family protein [Planctomycetaceae bacterium]